MIERIYIYFVLCLIIIIKSEVWTITHCLGLGHETMVCAVCLSVFLCTWFSLCSVLLWSETDWSYPYPPGSLHWHWDNHTIASMPLKPPWIRRMNHTNALWYYNQNNITKQVCVCVCVCTIYVCHHSVWYFSNFDKQATPLEISIEFLRVEICWGCNVAHWSLVIHSESVYWTIADSDNGFIVCSVPNHKVDRCWIIVNQTFRKKTSGKSESNAATSIDDNASENIVCKMSTILFRS